MTLDNTLSREVVDNFQQIALSYYRENARDLTWRVVDENGQIDPYTVTVSELMLQQTQVARVQTKFAEFMSTFATIESLSSASLSDVLRVWKGLGYNRRAKYLLDFAQNVQTGSNFPKRTEQLVQHKGIGINTAAAILIYAFDQRHVFVETNIRTVFIHHFFQDQDSVSDKEIEALVQATLPSGSVREWYWALMDYGTFIKRQGGAHLHKAKSYKKQSAFKGSMRELRSRILQLILVHKDIHELDITSLMSDERTKKALDALEKEKLITNKKGHYSIV